MTLGDSPAPQADQPAVLVQVEVTNGTENPIEDMFNGVPVVFPPGVPIVVTPEVAMHCFGYPGEPRDMAVHMAKRYGWATAATLQWASHKTPIYVEMASKMQFTPIFYDLVRRKPDDPIPAIVNDDEPPRPPSAEARTTVVGKNRRYANASRQKRGQADKPKSTSRRRTPHLNVTEV